MCGSCWLWGRKGGKTLIKTKSVRLDINTPLFFNVTAAATQSATWYIGTPYPSVPPIASPRTHTLTFYWLFCQLRFFLSYIHTDTLGLNIPSPPSSTSKAYTQGLIIERCVGFVSAGRSHEITSRCIKGYSIKPHLNHQENKVFCNKPKLLQK